MSSRGIPIEYKQRNKIINYYLLCSVRLGVRAHIINEIPAKKINVLLTQKEINLYLRLQNGLYVAREHIIGGEEPNNYAIVI